MSTGPRTVVAGTSLPCHFLLAVERDLYLVRPAVRPGLTTGPLSVRVGNRHATRLLAQHQMCLGHC